MLLSWYFNRFYRVSNKKSRNPVKPNKPPKIARDLILMKFPHIQFMKKSVVKSYDVVGVHVFLPRLIRSAIYYVSNAGK